MAQRVLICLSEWCGEEEREEIALQVSYVFDSRKISFNMQLHSWPYIELSRKFILFLFAVHMHAYIYDMSSSFHFVEAKTSSGHTTSLLFCANNKECRERERQTGDIDKRHASASSYGKCSPSGVSFPFNVHHQPAHLWPLLSVHSNNPAESNKLRYVQAEE